MHASFFKDTNDIRLIGGRKASEGRIEVKHNGIWGSICSQNFSLTEGMVICRSLGFKSRYVLIYSYHLFMSYNPFNKIYMKYQFLKL